MTNLYQSSNENMKMVLREKLKNVHMSKGEGMASHLSKITQVRYELAAIGEVIENANMVRTTLNGATRQWSVFVQTIIGRENISTWDRLWDDIKRRRHREDTYKEFHHITRMMRRMLH